MEVDGPRLVVGRHPILGLHANDLVCARHVQHEVVRPFGEVLSGNHPLVLPKSSWLNTSWPHRLKIWMVELGNWLRLVTLNRLFRLSSPG